MIDDVFCPEKNNWLKHYCNGTLNLSADGPMISIITINLKYI